MWQCNDVDTKHLFSETELLLDSLSPCTPKIDVIDYFDQNKIYINPYGQGARWFLLELFIPLAVVHRNPNVLNVFNVFNVFLEPKNYMYCICNQRAPESIIYPDSTTHMTTNLFNMFSKDLSFCTALSKTTWNSMRQASTWHD